MKHTVNRRFCLFAMLCLTTIQAFGGLITTNSTDSIQQSKEIISKLHPGIEPMDENVERDRVELANLGSNIYPGVKIILKTNEDPMVVGTLAGVISRMKADRSSLLPTIREMADRDQPWAREVCAAVLGEIGQPEDNNLLLQLINDSNERVQMASIKSISKIGRTNEISRLQSIRSARPIAESTESRKTDCLLEEVEKAILNIQKRSLLTK